MTVIRCHEKHLKARCEERGHDLESAKACIVSRDGSFVWVDTEHPAYPRAGLGDAVESVLSSVGITKERVSRLVGRPCGCEGRKKRLNQIGRKMGYR